MKLAYQNEHEIVDLAAGFPDKVVGFYPAESDLGHRFLASLREGSFAQRERPDFEDVGASLLLEVMRVDDHPRSKCGKKDATRAREGQVLRELREAGLVDEFPNATLVTNVSSGLPTDQDHNYRAYVEHFSQVVGNHASKMSMYRDERPGFDLGFLVLDESTPYFESMGSYGPPDRGQPHLWFQDAAFLEVILASELDCFVWVTPYKIMQAHGVGDVPLPKVIIIDVALLKRSTVETYDTKRMRSTEM